MAASHVELYEALKPHIGEQAAGMIAEVIPPAANLATKEDIESLRGEIHALEARMYRWGMTLVVPMWIAVLGTVVSLFLRH